MPDITTFAPFANGDVPDPDSINRLTYSPTTGMPNSCEVINGQLGSSNVDGWKVTHDMVRPRSCFGGDMVGLTGSLDYTPPVFTDQYTDTDAFLPLPGAALSFYLPIAPSFVIITWQAGGANAIKFGSDNRTRLRFYLDGVHTLQTRRISQSRHSHIEPHKGLRRPHRDRVWSGHYSTSSLSAGWHNASISAHNRSQTLRIRIRNMKVIWFK